jgi:hypothetical protein
VRFLGHYKRYQRQAHPHKNHFMSADLARRGAHHEFAPGEVGGRSWCAAGSGSHVLSQSVYQSTVGQND